MLTAEAEARRNSRRSLVVAGVVAIVMGDCVLTDVEKTAGAPSTRVDVRDRVDGISSSAAGLWRAAHETVTQVPATGKAAGNQFASLRHSARGVGAAHEAMAEVPPTRGHGGHPTFSEHGEGDGVRGDGTIGGELLVGLKGGFVTFTGHLGRKDAAIAIKGAGILDAGGEELSDVSVAAGILGDVM